MWHFFEGQYMPSYQVNRALTQAHYGGGEFAECLAAAAEITPGDNETFHRAWKKVGDRVYAEAEEAKKLGSRATARRAYLRAFNYLRTSEFFLKPSDRRKVPTYKKAVKSFREALKFFDNKVQRVKIPFEDSYLQGYLFKPAGRKKCPLMVMFGGLDSLAEELYFGPGQLFNERGVAFLAVDGPGQGESLRINHILTRHDYEVPATAVYEWAVANLDKVVDTTRIGVSAVSMGGYMAARSAAFEHRFKVCFIWGAVWSYYEIWKNRPDNHPLAEIVQHIVGATNMADARERLRQFDLTGVAEKIRIPTFIIHGEDDRQNFVENAYKVYEALTCAEKHLEVIPKESSGSAHCQIDDFTRAYPMIDRVVKRLME